MIRISISAKSTEELERRQQQAVDPANERDEPVVCAQYLRPPVNKPCMCGSGRKWKKCCSWEAKTQVVFYPRGYRFERKPWRRGMGTRVVGSLLLWMGALKWIP